MEQQNTNTPHKRRVRYSGTHPKRFEEKYKEHNPEKYSDIIEKVTSKGSTPAGMHIPIMVDEILDVLQIRPGMNGLDATLGYGGHTSKMLQALKGEGHLTALDIDAEEIAKTEKRLRDAGYDESVLSVIQTNFANIADVSGQKGLFDFLLADLGVSSMQIDNPKRGFTYKVEGPLDLRLDQSRGDSAAERLKQITLKELEGMLIENSDEPYAREISKAVMNEVKKGQMNTTLQLKEAITKALSHLPEKEREEQIKKCCARTFQALRIDVNSEFEVLYRFLEDLPGVMAPGGRVAILTFHSGEDRLVKQAFKQFKKDGIFSEISSDVIRPSKEECLRNPRSRSTKLRYAVRSDIPIC